MSNTGPLRGSGVLSLWFSVFGVPLRPDTVWLVPTAKRSRTMTVPTIGAAALKPSVFLSHLDGTDLPCWLDPTVLASLTPCQ